MTTRSDSHEGLTRLNVIQILTERLSQVTQPDARLNPFLEKLVEMIQEQWPDVSRTEIYLQDHDGSYRRWAGFGVPDDAPDTPPLDSPAARALIQGESLLDDAEPVRWAALLARGEDIIGVLEMDLAAGAEALPDYRTALLGLLPPLSLAVDYLQTIPLIRALSLNQPLTEARSPQEMVRVVAEYAGSGCSLVDLTLFEYDDEKISRARAIVLSMSGATEITDFSTDITDYPLRAALPELLQGKVLLIEDPYNTPRITPQHHAYFRAQGITRLAVLPLIVDGRLLGTLSVAGQRLMPNEMRGLQTLTNQIAVLVQNQALFQRTATALDEVHQLYRFGSAILNARDPASLIEAVYKQFSAPPDELSLETFHLDDEGHALAFTVQAAISAAGPGIGGTLIDVATYHLESFAQVLQAGTPILSNNVKTDAMFHSAVRLYFAGRHVQAVGVFPILVNGQLTNTITAAYTAPHIYTAPEIRLLHRLSEQIGLEVRTWELLQQTQEQAERLSRQVRLLESLYETSRQISANLTSPDILHTTCHSLADILALGYVAMVRFDQAPTSGVILAEYPARLGANTMFSLEGFAAYKHLQTYRTPVIIKQALTAADLLGPNLARLQGAGAQSVLLAPLIVQGDLIGMLVLATVGQVRQFSPEEINVAQTIATQVATGLRNAELFNEIQHRADQLERITILGRLVTSTFDRNEIMRRIIDVIPSLLPADQVSIALMSVDQRRMHITSLVGGAAPEEIDLPAEESSIAEVVQTQTPILVPDLQSSTYADHQRLAQQGLSALLIVPLIVGGRAMGTVNIGHRRARIYTPTDLTLLQQIGNQVAIALENARLFQVTQQRASYEESLGAITSRLQQQADLRDLLQQTMQDLGRVLGARRARVRFQVGPGPNGSKAPQVEE
jgi:GAF domain-containing protein